MTYNPQIVGAPTEQPAVDYFTGSAQGPFIDTGLYATDRQTGRRFGRIYLSADTVRHLASLLDEEPTPTSKNSNYAVGYLDGVKDVIGPDLVRTADSLRRWLDRIEPVADPSGDLEGN